jgi:large subunit ribosomal protein L29
VKADEIRELTVPEIEARINEVQEELFRLRFRSATQALDNPRLIRMLRRDVARMKTILDEQRLAEAGTAAEAE